MSKPLTEEQKMRMWDDIKTALLHFDEPQKGEYTVVGLMEATGFGRNKLRNRLGKMVRAGILDIRTGTYNGTSCNIYYPIKDVSSEELLKILGE